MTTTNPIDYRDPALLHSYPAAGWRIDHATRIAMAREAHRIAILAVRCGRRPMSRATYTAAAVDVVTDSMDGIGAVIDAFGAEFDQSGPLWARYEDLVRRWEPWEIRRRGTTNNQQRIDR